MNQPKKLVITWQRLLQEGATCPRCGATETEVEQAAEALRQALAPLSITVLLEKKPLSTAAFQQAPLQSNRILLNGLPLEEWLGATTGQSPCCEVCGPNNCRTVAVGAAIYETIPAELIIKAGLLAAAQLLGPDTAPPAMPDAGAKGCGCPT